MSEVVGTVDRPPRRPRLRAARRRRSRHLPVAARDALGAAPRPCARARRALRPQGSARRAACSTSSSGARRSIIGRLLHENGMWLVAPEDRRYGQDILIPKNATASATVGQVVAVELTEPPSMFSQPVGRVVEVLGEIDDPGMEIEIAVRKYEVPHRFSPSRWRRRRRCPTRCGPVDRRHRIDLTDVPLVTIDGEDARDFDDAVYCEPAKLGRARARRRLAPGGRDRRRQPLREARRADRRRRLRARHVGVLPAPRDPDAAGEAVQRPVLAEPGESIACAWCATCWSTPPARSTPTSSIRR